MGDEGKKPEDTRRRPMVVSKGWVQGIALVMILGFTVMGILAYHTYNDSIPIPDKVVSTTGEVLFTHDDIVAGQEAFNNRGSWSMGPSSATVGTLAPTSPPTICVVPRR
ncbi:nitric-oxide reductase [Cutibacterium acnes JCM 18918]|nr:nitric-oxide reductase [Cutibacterium acnes JCM 18918]